MAVMMDRRDAERLLGLTNAYTLDELRRTYKRHLAKFHPDLYPDEPTDGRMGKEQAQEEFVRGTQAFDALSPLFAGHDSDYRMPTFEQEEAKRLEYEREQARKRAEAAAQAAASAAQAAQATQQDQQGQGAPAGDGEAAPPKPKKKRKQKKAHTQQPPAEPYVNGLSDEEREAARRAYERTYGGGGSHALFWLVTLGGLVAWLFWMGSGDVGQHFVDCVHFIFDIRKMGLLLIVLGALFATGK